MIVEAKVYLDFNDTDDVSEVTVIGNVLSGDDTKRLVDKLFEKVYGIWHWGFSIDLISKKEEDGLYWPYIHIEDTDTQRSFKVYLTKKGGDVICS